MMQNEIVLYYSWYSICSEKVLFCLFEKAVDFQGHHVDLFDFDQVRPEYLKINPQGKVPTLVINGKLLADSTQANEFLDAHCANNPLIPEDAHKARKMREIIDFAEEKLFRPVGLISQLEYIADELKARWPKGELETLVRSRIDKIGAERLLKAVDTGFSEAAVQDAYDTVNAALGRLEATLSASGDWLAGEFSLADIAVAPNLFRLECLELETLWVSRFPKVSAWYKRVSKRPAFRQTYAFSPPHPQPHQPQSKSHSARSGT